MIGRDYDYGEYILNSLLEHEIIDEELYEKCKPHITELPGDHRVSDEKVSNKRLDKLTSNITKLEQKMFEKEYFGWELDNFIEKTEEAIDHLKSIQKGNVSKIEPSNVHKNSIDYLEDRLKKLKADKREWSENERVLSDYYDDFKKTCDDLGMSKSETLLYNSNDSMRIFDNPNNHFIKNRNGTSVTLIRNGAIYNQYRLQGNGTLTRIDSTIRDGKCTGPTSYDDVQRLRNYNFSIPYPYAETGDSIKVYPSKGSATFVGGFLPTRIPIAHTLHLPKSDDYVTLPDNTLRPVVASDGFNEKGNHEFDYDGNNVRVHFMGSGDGSWLREYTV